MEAYKNLDAKKLERKFFESKLLKDDRLYNLRAPGNTCINSLTYGRFQNFKKSYNFSKGCGGVMRVAPVGFYHKDPLKAFILGCEISVLTHGHVLGYVAAGYSAALISYLNEGGELEIAAKKALDILVYEKNDLSELTDDEKDSYQKITSKDLTKLNSLIVKSLKYAKLSQKDGKNYLKEIGEGWVAEETIAIAIYCALFKKDNFKDALRLAVNHDHEFKNF